MKPTIKDVAAAANVSIATVSRILNNQSGYSKQTKEKVLKVISEIGFQPSGVARGLVSKKTRTIGVLLPNVTASFSAKLLNGIEESAHENDYSVVVCNTNLNGDRTLDYLKVLGEKKVDGLIFTSDVVTKEYYEMMRALAVPVVLVASMSYRYPLPYVKVDDIQASYHATEYLITKGHKKIAMISGDRKDELAGVTRINGYTKALNDYDLDVAEDLIVYGDFGFLSGKKCMELLLARRNEFTAIFAASDEMALGALSVAYENDLRVPEDFSIIGYDNTSLADMSIPPLTTVGQPLREMGKRSIEKLIYMIEEGEDATSVVMSHQIIERSTVRQL